MAALPPQIEQQQQQQQTGAPVQATAVHPRTPKQRQALQSGATLTLLAIAFVLVCGMVALIVMGRYKRRVLGAGAKRRRGRATDAWVEAAKRMDPPPPLEGDASRDDTVDIDPEDLGPGDVGPGESEDDYDGFDPHGEPPQPPPPPTPPRGRGPRGGR